MKDNRLLAGILFGFTTGLALGVLLAPGDGAATRKLIRKRSAAFADSLNNMIKTLVSSDFGNGEDVEAHSNRLKIDAAESEFSL